MQKQTYDSDELKSISSTMIKHYENASLRNAIEQQKDKLRFLESFLELIEKDGDYSKRVQIDNSNHELWKIYETLNDQISETVDLIDTKRNLKNNQFHIDIHEKELEKYAKLSQI